MAPIDFKKYLVERCSLFLQEFDLKDPKLTQIQNLVDQIFHLSWIFFVLTTSYIVLRSLFLNIPSSIGLSEILDSIYQQGWLEVLFLIVLSAQITTVILRLFLPIRISSKFCWLSLMAFALCFIEQNSLHDFYFFKAKTFKVDYFYLFLLPPTSELMLRLLYVFARKTSINASLFGENQPIQQAHEDKTTRRFAIDVLAEQIKKSFFNSSYSIGIIGDWGVGKTSYIRILEKKVTHNAIIIHFNPWLSTGRNSLIAQFIESLKEELCKYDKSIGPSLDNYLLSLVELEKTTKTNIGNLFKNILTQQKSSASEFTDIKKSISRIGKRIIVFIDDLDRLDKTEIIDILKLIRNTGNFPNTIYISCYDKIYLLHALQTFSRRNLTILLDKFFDLEIPLSPIPSSELIKMISENFLKKHSINTKDSGEILQQFHEGFFLQFRDVKKFLTSLSINYELYGKTLYVKDFFYFEILKVKFPFLPSILWNERKDFFNEQQTPALLNLKQENSTLRTTEGESEWRFIIEGYLTEAESNASTKTFLDAREIKVILTILGNLFPSRIGSPYAIQEPNFFEAYFYNNTPDPDTFVYTNWYTTIIQNQYPNHKLFETEFDIKNEQYIWDVIFGNEALLKSTFGDQPDSFFNFLVFLVDWSLGKINIRIFKKAYEALPVRNKEAHFNSCLCFGDISTKIAVARTNFISIIIRQYIYDPGFALDFASLNSLKTSNQYLFSEYLKQIKAVTIDAFAILYNQIDTINSETNLVQIVPNALEVFKTYVQDYPNDYLDLNIRSEMVPNYDGTFVFEPVTTPKLFNDKLTFIDFINSSKYPEFKKKKIIEYLNLSERKSEGTLRFQLSSEQLKTMPIDFKNAWRRISYDLLEQVSYTANIFNYIFVNQIPPSNDPDLNDHILDHKFELLESSLLITIRPNNTKFWRLGLKFSKNQVFLTDMHHQRHTDKWADIHVSVGQRNNEKNEWRSAQQLEVTEYNVPINSKSIQRFMEYKGGVIQLSFKFIKKSSAFIGELEVIIENKSLGVNVYNLSSYEFYTIAAWADQKEFNLNTTIAATYNVKTLFGQNNGY
jgi:hypothetical protein